MPTQDLVVVAGHEQDAHLRTLFAQRVGELLAVRPRHDDVGDEQINIGLALGPDSLCSVGVFGLEYLVAAVPQCLRSKRAHDRLVFYQQDALPAALRGARSLGVRFLRGGVLERKVDAERGAVPEM